MKMGHAEILDARGWISRPHTITEFKCKCDCGNVYWRRATRVINSSRLGFCCSQGCRFFAERYVGARFGRVTIVAPPHKGCYHYLCKCDCGKQFYRTIPSMARTVNNGGTPYCDPKCPLAETDYDNEIISLIGERKHRLKIIDVTRKTGLPSQKGTTVKCKCDCGRTLSLALYAWKYTNTLTASCGKKCLFRKDDMRKRGDDLRKRHGAAGDLSIGVWNIIRLGATAYKRRRGTNKLTKPDIPFEIDIKYAWSLFLKQDRRCALTGRLLSIGLTIADGTASLDRIDSSRGYVDGNVQWIYKPLQRVKWGLDESCFIDMCKKIAKHADNKTIATTDLFDCDDEHGN